MDDAKEIYQAVLKKCMEQIDNIKKEYGEQVVKIACDRMARQYEGRIASLEKKNEELSQKLERLTSGQGGTAFENMIDSLFRTGSQGQTSAGNKGKSDRLSAFELQCLDAFEYDGWLYYVNEKQGNLLYKVRTDGTGNQRLTDYSVMAMRALARVENGRLYFVDPNYGKHSIKL